MNACEATMKNGRTCVLVEGHTGNHSALYPNVMNVSQITGQPNPGESRVDFYTRRLTEIGQHNRRMRS